MPARILAVGLCRDEDTASAIEMSARAGRRALDAAGILEVGALINVGVFRDDNIVEPAVAALIQQRIGIALEYTSGAVPTFSFDLMNGACGLLDAVAVAGALLDTGSVDTVLITAGDTHPSQAPHPDFPYASAAGALLLGHGPTGFGSLHVAATTDDVAPTSYIDLGAAGAQARGTITVEAPPRTPFAAQALAACAAAEGLDPATVPVLTGPDPHLHTAALIFAYAERQQTDSAMLLLADGGATAACIAYRERS